MRNAIRPMAAVLLVGGLAAGCSGSPVGTAAEDTVDLKSDAASVEDALAANLAAHETEADWDPDSEVAIDLSDDGTTVSGEGASVDGSTVTISRPGTYRLSGTLTDGQVVVSSAAQGLVRLVLDGADITSATTAPIAVEQAEQAVVVLADGSTNSLADTARTAGEDERDGALFSRADLTVTGTGSLEVTGALNDGIAANDGLVIDSGTVSVRAADDGIRGKDYVVITGGEVGVTSEGDGLKSDNEEDTDAGYVAVLGGSVTVNSGADGLDAATDVIVGDGTVDVTSGGGGGGELAEDASAKGLKGDVSVVVGGGSVTVDAADDAVHSDGAATITGGALTLATGDDGVHAEETLTVTGGDVEVTRSEEGLEAAAITISGGDVTVVSADDGINAAGGNGESGAEVQASATYSVTITGGTVVIDAGGDGLDSNGTVDMTGGTVVVAGPTNDGNGALDVLGEFTVEGGTLLAAGSSGMATAPSTDSPQASVLATFDPQEAGTVVAIATTDGEVVAAFESPKDFSSVVLSSAELVAGETYDVLVGGTVSGEATAGLHDDADLAGATAVATVTGGEYSTGPMGGPGSAEGDLPQPPAEGDLPQPPADGEMPQPPADGEMPQPPSGTEGRRPERPADSERPERPADGERSQDDPAAPETGTSAT